MTENAQIYVNDAQEMSMDNSSSCQGGNTLDYSDEVVRGKAGPGARGTEATDLTTPCDENDDFCDDSSDLLLIDPKSYDFEPLTKTELSSMPKRQIVDYAAELQICYADIAHEYGLLAEQTRKNNHLKWVTASDKISALNGARNRKNTEPVETEEETAENKKEDAVEKEKASESNTSGEKKTAKQKSTPKRKPGQKQKWGGMPYIEEVVDFDEEEKERLFPGGLHYIRDEVLEEIRVVPFRLYCYRKRVRVYQDLETKEFVRNAYAKEVKFLPGSRISAEFLGYIAEQYYMQCIPVDRQVKMYNLEGCPITASAVYKWLRDYGEKSIQPIAMRMSELVLKRPVIQSDETYVRSIEELLDSNRRNCFFWLIRSSELDKEAHPIVAFHFVKHRSVEELKKILGDYEGSIMCDGYGTYPAVKKLLTKVMIACCLSHVRHYFVIAFKGISNTADMTSEQLNKIPSYKIINKIGEIFKKEEKCKDASREERISIRYDVRKETEKLYDMIEDYAKATDFDGRNLFGKAVTYAKNRKDYIYTAIDNPDIPIHNSACERSFISKSIFRNNIKAFQKNRNAEVAANYFTVGTTCKENGVDPETYFRFLFEKMPAILQEHELEFKNNDLKFLDSYMPWESTYKAYENGKLKEAFEFFSHVQGLG